MNNHYENDSEAMARPTDPDTSHDAAASLSKPDISRLKQMIIDSLQADGKGQITHEMARDCDIGRDTFSPRMKSLVAKGLVYDTGRRRAWEGADGRPATTRVSIVYQLTSLCDSPYEIEQQNRNGNGGAVFMNQIDRGPIMCFVHLDREATRVLNVPCAPDGQLFCCDYCFGDGRTEMFAAYAKVHEARVRAKRAEEKIRKAEDN
jgi:hypothetical protein